MTETETETKKFLEMIRRVQRSRLKVYVGYRPGVGKTYHMLLEARQLQKEGIDVVIALVETHDRSETAKLLEGLEIVPRRRVEHGSIFFEEMDVDAVIKRHAVPLWHGRLSPLFSKSASLHFFITRCPRTLRRTRELGSLSPRSGTPVADVRAAPVTARKNGKSGHPIERDYCPWPRTS